MVIYASRNLTRYINGKRKCTWPSVETNNGIICVRTLANGSRNVVSTPPPVQDEILNRMPKKEPIVFPWRHQEECVSRVIPGTVEYATKGQLLSSTKMKAGNSTLNAYATAFMFLDVPLFELLFFNSWKADLADSVSWAFCQGVAGILSNTYRVPLEDVKKGDYHIDFSHEVDNSSSRATDEENETAENDPVKLMVEENLLTFYKSARAAGGKEPENYTIRLKMRSYDAELISLFCIPYISRSNAKRNPVLRDNYRKMLEKPQIERAPELSQLRKRYLDSGTMESTVIAQVLVWCNELFYVKDKKTGKILQGGYEDNTNENDLTRVPHLVRMEMTVKTGQEGKRLVNQLGNWEITDIDDHLDGNLVV